VEAHRHQRLILVGDAAAVAVILVIALAIGEAAVFGGYARGTGFLFGDEGNSLFVASRLLQHARLYRDVAYIYGWLPITLYLPAARVFGNTPVVYLQFLLFWSMVGLLLGYAVVRQLLWPLAATVVVVIGLLPVFLIPGSLLGGYISAFYMPIDRVVILAALLAWQPPSHRSTLRGVVLGTFPVVMQLLRFGPGIVLLAAIILVDTLALWTEPPPAVLRVWLRTVGLMTVVSLAGELVIAICAITTLPHDVAVDLIWPSYLRAAYPAWSARWPTWNGSRLLVAQYANPIAGAVLSLGSAALIFSRRESLRGARFLLAPLLFLLGMFSFFRTVDHFRQFAWMLTIGALPALSRWRAARMAAILLWIPVFAVVVRTAFRPGAPDSVEVVSTAGWRLTTSQSDAIRIERLRHAIDALVSRGRTAVVFYPNGSGFYVAYGYEPPGRTVWFFPRFVRPYEIPQLAHEFQRAGVFVDCSREHTRVGIPAPLRTTLEARLGSPEWIDQACAVFRLTDDSLSRK
jgi:hypothetical protein